MGRYPVRGTMSRRARMLATAAMASIVLSELAGCTAVRTASPAQTTVPGVTATARPTPVPAATMVPGGTAQQNLPFFDAVNRRTIAANANPASLTFIDALAAAGFNKADMQVSADKTTVGLQPGSIQFSVKIGDSCLIGQYGSDIGGYHSMVAAPISTGSCLIGDTVPLT